MKNVLKKGLAFVLALVMIVGLIPAVDAAAVTLDYQYGSTDDYSSIIKNWGERGELATFLSPNAEDFYSTQSFSYDEYVALDGTSGDDASGTALYEALYTLMSEAHTTITDYDDIRYVFQFTDCENSGETSATISGFYSGVALPAAWDSGTTWNREHTWPQSKSEGGDDIEDIMSIRPESASVNSSRGNKAYGESSSCYDPNSESGGIYDLHGDVARVILYTYVRWGHDSTTLQGNLWGESGVFESKEILLQWMEEDPVDTWEMGRNDSVESITGTRNVFVDYPELAFALFDEEVPEMDTPSGNAKTVSYTVTAQSSNTAYGTVSVNNDYITAHPATGYKTTGYEVISGSAAVTQNGDVFTVSASGDCVVQINFAAKQQFTASFVEDGGTASTQSAYEQQYIVLPACSGTVPEGYTFRGWVTEIVYNTTEKPANIYAAGSEYVLQSDTTFYALMSYENAEDTSGGSLSYVLVTSADQLTAGKSVVIAAAAYDKALSTTQNTNNRGAADVIKNGSALVFDSDDGVQEMTLVEGTADGSFGFYTGSGYLYAASSSGNYLKTQTTLDANGSFVVTVNDDGSCTLVAQGTNSRNTLFYNTQPLFSCYSGTSSSSQIKPISLYVGVAGGTTYYTMAWTYDPTEPTECVHSNCTTETVEADCVNAGSKTVTCNDCGETVSQETIPALGHEYNVITVAPDCTNQGYTLHWCDVCDDEYTDNYVDALGHSYETVTVEPTYGQEGSITQTCATCGDVITEVIPALTNPVTNWNICLSDSIGVNFYVAVGESDEIAVTVNGVPAQINCTDGVVKLELAAAQMMDTIALAVNGVEMEKTYSVRQYADEILSGDYDDATKNLVKQMLHYGAAAQSCFGYNVTNLANDGIEELTTEIPATTAVHTAQGSVEGLSYTGASLLYNSKIAVRFYFTAESVDGISFQINGAACSPVYKNGMYYVEAADIGPQNYDEIITLTVNDTMTVTYSPLTYIIRMYNKETEASATKTLVYALYGYHLAAKAYVAN